MSGRYRSLVAALLGVVTTLAILAGVVVAMPGQSMPTSARPTLVILPTPSPTPLPIVTASPTTPAGDVPATIAPFGDG
jgi:hypothetical protein